MRGRKVPCNRRVHTAENMLKAVKMHRNGVSLRKAAEMCCVKFSTLRRYTLKCANVRLENLKYQRLTPNYGVNKIFSREQEELLIEFLKEHEGRYGGVCTGDMRRAAYEMAEAFKLSVPENWRRSKMAGVEWYRAFRGRHPGFSLKRSNDPRRIDEGDVSAFCEAHRTEDPIECKREIVEPEPELRKEEEEPQVGVWSYFEREPNGRARCAVCRAVVSKKLMRSHLREQHPKLVFEDETTEDEASDTQEDVYTEVVYLEDEQNPKTPKKEKRETPTPNTTHTSRKSKRRDSSSDDEPLQQKQSKKDDPDDIAQFTKYVASLLKRLPSDACMELQLEIVNLIMRKQLELKRKPASATEKMETSVNMDSSGMQSFSEHSKPN